MHHTASHGSEAALARLLFGELAAELDAALGADSGSAGTLDRALDAAARQARAGELGRAAFDGVSEPEAERLERSFRAARAIAARGGIELPEPEAFWDVGIDRGALARGLITDREFVAVPAPHGLGVAGWTGLFRAAARQPGSPLSLASPLIIAADVEAAIAELDAPPRGVARVRTPGGIEWTLRLVPAGAAPSRPGQSHAFGPHPTLAEMLMLQLMRVEFGEDPVDAQSFTWLHGSFDEGRFAARHLFDSGERSVRVNAREVGNQGPHLGARPPLG